MDLSFSALPMICPSFHVVPATFPVPEDRPATEAHDRGHGEKKAGGVIRRVADLLSISSETTMNKITVKTDVLDLSYFL